MAMIYTSQVSLQQPLNPHVREECSVNAWVDEEDNTKRCTWPGLAQKGRRCGKSEVKRGTAAPWGSSG